MSKTMRKSVFFFLFLFMLNTISLPHYAHAQDQAEEDTSSAREPLVVPITPIEDLEKNMFPKTLDGCGKRTASFLAIAESYKEGRKVSDIGVIKASQVFFQRMYDKNKKKGIMQSRLDKLEEYRECLKDVMPDRRPEKDVRQKPQHIACSTLTGIVLNTLSGIKRKVPEKAMIAKYQSTKLDLSQNKSVLKEAESPQTSTINTLYETAEKYGYEPAQEQGISIAGSCIGMIR